MDEVTERAVNAMLDHYNDTRRLVTHAGTSVAELEQIKRDVLAMAEEVSRG